MVERVVSGAQTTLLPMISAAVAGGEKAGDRPAPG
jgi:hypothetical protein